MEWKTTLISTAGQEALHTLACQILVPLPRRGPGAVGREEEEGVVCLPSSFLTTPESVPSNPIVAVPTPSAFDSLPPVGWDDGREPS